LSALFYPEDNYQNYLVHYHENEKIIIRDGFDVLENKTVFGDTYFDTLSMHWIINILIIVLLRSEIIILPGE